HLKGILEEIHVTWTQFGKKQTRLQLYTEFDQELMASQFLVTTSKYSRDIAKEDSTGDDDLKRGKAIGIGSEVGGLFSPTDDEGEPFGSNTEVDSETNDIVEERSFVDDQASVQIGEENFPGGNIPENNNVHTHFSTLRRVVVLEVFCKNKKHATLSKSSAKAEYRLMAAATCEVMCIMEKVEYGFIRTAKIDSQNQIANILTKALRFLTT
ncbi:hypothetical protein Tco_1181182, partial [Tanacetum coccineum]